MYWKFITSGECRKILSHFFLNFYHLHSTAQTEFIRVVDPSSFDPMGFKM